MKKKSINEDALSVITGYYAPRSYWLEQNCNIGKLSYTCKEANLVINDDLLQSIDIYDVATERRYAGFSNCLEDLFFKTRTPKWHHKDALRKDLIRNYDTSYWDLETWIFVFLVHRVTGSGASFVEDHGYRNSVVQHFGRLNDIDSMKTFVQQTFLDKGVVTGTSIGNQYPPTPIWPYLMDHAPRLARLLSHKLQDSIEPMGHKAIVDFMNGYNIDNGFKRFNFQFTAVSLDLSDYMPDVADATSHTYLGSNAKRQVKLMFPGYKDDEAMEILQSRVPFSSEFKSLEDFLCDGCRFLEDYDPKQRGIHFNNSGFDASPWFKDRSGANRW